MQDPVPEMAEFKGPKILYRVEISPARFSSLTRRKQKDYNGSYRVFGQFFISWTSARTQVTDRFLKH